MSHVVGVLVRGELSELCVFRLFFVLMENLGIADLYAHHTLALKARTNHMMAHACTHSLFNCKNKYSSISGRRGSISGDVEADILCVRWSLLRPGFSAPIPPLSNPCFPPLSSMISSIRRV